MSDSILDRARAVREAAERDRVQFRDDVEELHAHGLKRYRDRRLKKDLEKLVGALAAVERLAAHIERSGNK